MNNETPLTPTILLAKYITDISAIRPKGIVEKKIV